MWHETGGRALILVCSPSLVFTLRGGDAAGVNNTACSTPLREKLIGCVEPCASRHCVSCTLGSCHCIVTTLDLLCSCSKCVYPMTLLLTLPLVTGLFIRIHINIFRVFIQVGNLLRQNPGNPHLLFARAKCLYSMGNLDAAIKHLAEAARHDPDNRCANFNTAVSKLIQPQGRIPDLQCKCARFAASTRPQ
jgi:Tetratricopeptide repeat